MEKKTIELEFEKLFKNLEENSTKKIKINGFAVFDQTDYFLQYIKQHKELKFKDFFVILEDAIKTIIQNKLISYFSEGKISLTDTDLVPKELIIEAIEKNIEKVFGLKLKENKIEYQYV